jgi:hypothetical protein
MDDAREAVVQIRSRGGRDSEETASCRNSESLYHLAIYHPALLIHLDELLQAPPTSSDEIQLDSNRIQFR